MFLTYNGIELQIEHVISYEQTPVYDPSGADYLYTHHRIHVRAVWNPAATTDNDNAVAAVAVPDLRSSLLQPRALLTFDVPNGGGVSNNVITSPWLDPDGIRYPCDANNGPKPIGEPIITVVGEKTMIVDFAVETWINECSGNRPLLSHRWEMSQEIDQDCYTTRAVTGIAIFRTDWLASRPDGQASPDDFRSWLVHPIPDNSKRTRIVVKTSSDNTTLQYTFIDVEQPANITAQYRNVSRFEATYSTHEGVSTLNPLKAGEFCFPRKRITVNIRAFGKRSATRADLGNAIAAIGARFQINGAVVFGQFIPAFFFQTTYFIYDAFNRYMECRVESDVAGIFSRLTEVAGVGPYSFNGDPTIASPVLTRFNLATSNPDNSGGSRGTWLQRCVAQTLLAPCTTPSLPPDQTNALNTLPFYILPDT